MNLCVLRTYTEPWVLARVSIRKTFAQFFRNETQNFSFFVHQFCAKKQQFAQSFTKVISRKLPFSAFAKLKFCPIPQLEFCAIPQFRKNQTVGDGVCFLEFNSVKILFHGMSFYIWSLLHNWPMTVKKSSNLTIFSTILVLDMHIY